MDAASPWKHWKIYNLWTTYGMKMKLTTILYDHETYHLTKVWGVTYRGWEGVAKKPLKKGPKIVFLDPFLGIFSTITKTVTYVKLCLALHHWWKFRTNLTWFGVAIHEKSPKSSQKYYFLLVRETLKCINLTTTNAMKMKLARIVYLYETFHLPKNLVVTHTAKEDVIQKLLNPHHKMRFLD